MYKLAWSKTSYAYISTKNKEYDGHSEIIEEQQVDSSIVKLCNKLIQYGGISVCVPFSEPDSLALVRRGRIFDTEGLQMQIGEVRQCHNNSAELWKQDKSKYSIVTGYSLSEHDEMWRQHSWVVTRKGFIIETTEQRIMYYGIKLGRIKSHIFADLQN